MWPGRTVRTAVWKKPVAGARMARRLNIDGDGQGDLAGHGGEQRAVFVYQIESRSDLSAHWDAGYASLLEFAEACDVPVRWSCRTGGCHTCETTVISGNVSYAPAPVDEPADGSTLICCAQPSEDLVLDL
jgi:ferredoxin